MALTKVTGQVINNTTGLVVGVTTVGGGISATDGFFSGIVTAVGNASFSGNVSVGGTLTYEDVTNIDAVGLVTARNGVVVGSGITLSKDGDVFFTGIATGNGSGLTNLTAGNLTGALPAISGANLTGVAATDNVRTGILDVAGVGTFRGDVNIPDKIIHLGDTNTAIRFPSADTITAETGGSERLRIDSSGRMGLGITPTDYHSNNTAVFQLKDGNTIFSRTGGTFLGMFQNIKYNSSDVSQYVTSNPGSAYFQTSGVHKFYTAASGTADNNATLNERVCITLDGNFGLATNSPVAQTLAGGTAITPVLDLKGTSQNNTSGVLQLTRKDNATQGSCIYSSGDDAGLTFRNTDGNGFGFYNGTTNALRIRPDGRIGINCTPDYLFNVVSDSNDMCRFQQTTNDGGSSYSMIFMKHAAARSGSNGIDITFQNDSGTTVGMIDHGQSTTQYRTSSDYRLKENAEAISDGITRLKTLKPYRFNWISEPDQPKVDGFFAHEVTAVPEAIKGTKDEVDSDNKPLYQSIDHSKLVPLLTAALQEAITEIETLKTKVAALEGS